MTGGRVVAVTGAAGFLGAHIVTALAAEGARLRILSHHRPPHPLWQGMPAEIVAGSVTDAAACARLAAGADAVVHAAGLIKALSRAAFFAVNATGTATIAQATRVAAPDARFVLVSSLAARAPFLSPYAASKQAGESGRHSRLRRPAGSTSSSSGPRHSMAPWDREGLPLFKAASRELAPVFGTGRAVIMHVHDAAAAIVRVALGDGAAGCYALPGPGGPGVPGGTAYTVRQLLQEAARAVGSHPRLLQIPALLLHAAGTAAGWQAQLRRRPAIFTAGKAREMLHDDWTISAAEALPASIHQPSIALHDGFRSTVDWYRANGWLA